VTPAETATDPPLETSLHWIPLSKLSTREPIWSNVTVDVASRLAPRHSWIKILVRILVGSMQFSAIVLDRPAERESKRRESGRAVRRPAELKLWGLTLGMTLDFLACMQTPLVRDDKAPGSPSMYAFNPHSPESGDEVMGLALAPSMTCVHGI
jgi:hypothetical protein